MSNNLEDELFKNLSDLPRWGREYLLHLREHRPSDYAALEASGQLLAQAQNVAGMANQAFDQRYEQLLQQHSPAVAHQIAWEQIEQEYIYLPDERSVPVLGDKVEQLPEEPNDDLDPEHLETLQELSDLLTEMDHLNNEDEE